MIQKMKRTAAFTAAILIGAASAAPMSASAAYGAGGNGTAVMEYLDRGIRVWCSTAPTDVRLTTLMHDMQYRAQNCCQQSSYNQPPHTSYYLGSDAPLPARPKVVINGEAVNPPEPIKYTDGK